jgi:hypothetical protein
MLSFQAFDPPTDLALFGRWITWRSPDLTPRIQQSLSTYVRTNLHKILNDHVKGQNQTK